MVGRNISTNLRIMNPMELVIGIDLGTQGVRAIAVDMNGSVIASANEPLTPVTVQLPPGWAEQDPNMWWENLKNATAEVLSSSRIKRDQIIAIGISYQMHGLVVIDKQNQVLRPSIIWCDSRAVEIGQKAFSAIGSEKCLSSLSCLRMFA